MKAGGKLHRQTPEKTHSSGSTVNGPTRTLLHERSCECVDYFICERSCVNGTVRILAKQFECEFLYKRFYANKF